MINEFKIDSKLENDSYFITRLELSEVRLINNSDYMWLILVPQLTNVTEITDLEPNVYSLLWHEVNLISRIMQKLYKPDKLNIASIGNIVKQLHIHIIARFKNDKLFPKPVWGCEFEPYIANEFEVRINEIKEAIENHIFK